MPNAFFYFLFIIMTSMGLAIILTEKGHTWPVRRYRIKLQRIMHMFHWRWPQALKCVTCTSFWTAGLIEIIVNLVNIAIKKIPHATDYIQPLDGVYFLWPLTGFATAGITYLIFELINALDKESDLLNMLGEDED